MVLQNTAVTIRQNWKLAVMEKQKQSFKDVEQKTCFENLAKFTRKHQCLGLF